MRFWKQILFTVILLTGTTVTLLYTSCVKNACDNVSCKNGGSCNGQGICRCPTGYEGSQCETLSISRYLGGYVGNTECNSLVPTIDTVTISADDGMGINGVQINMKSLFSLPENKGLLYGVVSSDPSVYTIIVKNDDSSSTLIRDYTITLTNNTQLQINEYIWDYRNPADTIIETCQFNGAKF